MDATSPQAVSIHTQPLTARTPASPRARSRACSSAQAMLAGRVASSLLSSALLLRPPLARVAASRRAFAAMQGPPLPDHLETMREELAAGEAQLFDVREPGEWAQGHLVEALTVPLSDLRDGIVPPHEKTVLTYVHCAAGVRVRANARSRVPCARLTRLVLPAARHRCIRRLLSSRPWDSSASCRCRRALPVCTSTDLRRRCERRV